METNFGSWFNHQYLYSQSARSSSAFMNSHFNEFLTNGEYPLFTFSAQPQYKAGQPNEPHNWFNCLPCFPQNVNNVPREKIPAASVNDIVGLGNCNTGTECSNKRFLVFDKSDDQTALVYSSVNCSPVQCLDSWSLEPLAGHNSIKEHTLLKRDEKSHFGNLASDEHIEESHREGDSEWHEDTDELNALIYCDNDYDDSEDDDDVTSTGRSPSTMTVHDKSECSEERGEEVESSSAGPTKRRKLSDGGYDVLSFMHAAMTAKPNMCSELEDDAQSSCNDNNEVSTIENIRKTISVLQNIVPGVKGKDAVIVLDETIRCLRSLKAEAKSLGLDHL